MKRDDVLLTSPLFVVRPGGRPVVALDLIDRGRFKSLAPEVLDLVSFFLTPTTVGDAVAAGYEPVVIAAGLEAGLLISVDHARLEAAQAWEDHRWTRAAYLLFSQQDLDYTEPTEDGLAQDDLVEVRRQTIREFLDAMDYPAIRLAPALRVIDLPESLDADELQLDLDALFRRRSVRKYAEEPVPLAIFADTLHTATRNVRLANESKRAGDPFFLLNSFYSWLQVYVVVQGVEGIPRGIYQYDPEAHQLRCVADGVEHADILACIQHQDWIGGAGWCTFFVVQWSRYQWLYRHARAYINLLIQLGEIGQEFLQAVSRHGLGAWPTPAVHETNAAHLLHLDPIHEDAMYFMKIGPRGSDGRARG